MFTFAFETDGVLSFIHVRDHIFTWPDEKTAREFFNPAIAHLYQITMDLQIGHLIERGNNSLEGPDEIYPDDEQKEALFNSFVYPSLLQWAPIEQTIEVPV